MEILLAFIFGGVIGLAAQYALPGRETRGVALAPVIGAFVGGVVWTILTWTGVGTDSIWIWLSAIVAPAIITFPLIAGIARLRAARDAREKHRLKIA